MTPQPTAPRPALTKTQQEIPMPKQPKGDRNREAYENRLAAERLADRNRRWRAALGDCMDHCGVFDDDKLAAVFDAIASEASTGEVPEVLRR